MELLARWLRDAAFIVELEASFSEWGERGRIDLLACDPASRLLQELLGSVNVRERLAATIGGHRGWDVDRCVTLLAVADVVSNRSIVRDHPSLFGSFRARRLSRSALAGTDRLLVGRGVACGASQMDQR